MEGRRVEGSRGELMRVEGSRGEGWRGVEESGWE